MVVMRWISTGRSIVTMRVTMFVIMAVVVAAVLVIVVMMVMCRIRAGRVIVIVRSIRMIIRKKLRINIQNRIQIKAADIDQLLEIGFTKMNGFD